MKKKIVIIDYGVGNLRSVLRGLERAGAAVTITADPETIASADGIVLPGVGAFRDGMEMLGGLGETVRTAARGTPLIGICLGMQMLMDRSEEHGIHRGLGLVPGDVKRFAPVAGEKVPHMGWNTIRFEGQDPLFEGLREEEYVYFVHSYYAAAAPEHTLTSTPYIRPFASSVKCGLTYGVQFHPEKSGAVGLKILENFIERVC
ncbi:imidazole glycerol phosphate synthase subunit HisH [Methanoculleus sp. Wushi-C6]|uniref:Imidazole glycerol phosphate synthase subunit HisH n=1 Tax=Methanoculleus caldifontis TaxID=2651577 RepID=A0ABU3X3M1_9EURY|nr:imidazole glycerol phosphate synthase subunit HisH [Methanoculleus sp. Wushi-C6]MDV2482536.1 imidazole glycerol phosphate synthase subunit HisH [Methanoculleus sp. Wushi-C6]